MHKKIDGKLYLQKKGLIGSNKDAHKVAAYMKKHYGYKSTRVVEEDGGYRIYVR